MEKGQPPESWAAFTMLSRSHMYKSHVDSVCRQWGLQQTCLIIKPRGGRGDSDQMRRITGKQLDGLCTQAVYSFCFFSLNDLNTWHAWKWGQPDYNLKIKWKKCENVAYIYRYGKICNKVINQKLETNIVSIQQYVFLKKIKLIWARLNKNRGHKSRRLSPILYYNIPWLCSLSSLGSADSISVRCQALQHWLEWNKLLAATDAAIQIMPCFVNDLENSGFNLWL